MLVDNKIGFSSLEGNRMDTRRLSDMYWGQKGWTGGTRNGLYVGCPELPDGSKQQWDTHQHCYPSMNTL